MNFYFFSGDLFICENRKFAIEYSFFNNILHKLAKTISHQKKIPEAGGYLFFTTYKLAMMPRGTTSLPHDTCQKTCRETMLHWHVEGKGLSWLAETVVVVFFFVSVGSVGGSRQGAYACTIGGKKNKKKKSWKWFCRKEEFCQNLELGFVEETLILRRIVERERERDWQNQWILGLD